MPRRNIRNKQRRLPNAEWQRPSILLESVLSTQERQHQFGISICMNGSSSACAKGKYNYPIFARAHTIGYYDQFLLLKARVLWDRYEFSNWHKWLGKSQVKPSAFPLKCPFCCLFFPGCFSFIFLLCKIICHLLGSMCHSSIIMLQTLLSDWFVMGNNVTINQAQ